MTSTMWVAGTSLSVLRRNEVHGKLALRHFDIGSDREFGRLTGGGDMISVRQTTEPTKRLPFRSAGSSS